MTNHSSKNSSQVPNNSDLEPTNLDFSFDRYARRISSLCHKAMSATTYISFILEQTSATSVYPVSEYS